jgi:hypothetical protein
MLYDEHRKLGYEHARMGMKRHKWGDPHLQAAYDEGYRLVSELEEATDDYWRARQSIPGMPGIAKKKPRY